MRDSSGGARCLAIVSLIAAATGCATNAPPRVQSGTPSIHAERFSLGRYLPNYEACVRTFERTTQHGFSKTRQRVRQFVDDRGRTEGSLSGQTPWPMARFLDPHSNRPDRIPFQWPISARGAAAGYFVDFKPPLTRWPATLGMDTPFEQKGRLVAFDRGGRPFANGTVERAVWFEGWETIDAGRKTYPRCAVLRSLTTMVFSWWARVVLDERVWMSENIGIVRRDERIHGTLLLVLPFQGEYRYELESILPVGSRSDRTPPRAWRTIAIHLDRLPPRPRVGGLSVEWAVAGASSPVAFGM